ncbi:MAG: hypothetical protein JWP81_1459 [Ferruginibacter sp.]|nr:hypothetical protein [Ferruginibacter sp.]
MDAREKIKPDKQSFTERAGTFIFTNCIFAFIGRVLFFSAALSINGFAQTPETPVAPIEQQLEASTENNEDAETEDDSFLQSMHQFLKHPLNLNTVDISTLEELAFFSPLQIRSLVNYRNLFGNFLSIYELQAVPGFDLQFIARIRPFITVSIAQSLVSSIHDRLTGGTSTMLARVSMVLEKQKGFTTDRSTTSNFYPGSRQRLYMRYQYRLKNLLQYGVVGEKDAGEQFFKGAQKNGFDFYSAHLFVRNIGIIKSLAIGDFTVNLGQGLIQWQSLAFKKSTEVTNIKRQLAVLRPYNSAGEINFHRGIGITLAKNNMEVTLFASYKGMDANIVLDTLNNDDYISSLQTSGLHRTKSETSDKGVQRQFAVGSNIAYNAGSFHFGVNAVQYRFALPIHKRADPYNLFALSGKNFGNYSADYSYGYKNLHFFGEAAITNHFYKAFVNGLIISADAKTDVSLLYRNISKSYQSLYSNAFTENTSPNNEKGLYIGITTKPNTAWRIDAYVDLYKFPWLRYLVDAASAGSDYMMQATYKPNKQLEGYIRYRWESKSKNDHSDELTLSAVVPKARQNFRSHFSYKLNNALTLRSRVEMIWFDKKGEGAQKGFLTFADFIIKPLMKKYSGSCRLQYFETDGYDSRLYAYENDVLYGFSIPVFYDKGYRYYLNFNYAVSSKLELWFRWAQTIYNGKTIIGTGLDAIAGNKRTEVKIQVRYGW